MNEFTYPDSYYIDGDSFDKNNTIIWSSFDDVFEDKKSILMDQELNDIKKQLFGYMLMKDTIATYIWVTLLGSISILVTQNMLLSENCSKKIEKDSDFQDYIATQLKD